MPRILAIDWDLCEARAVLLVSGATGTSLAGAWAVPLETAEGAGPTHKQTGARLAAACARQPLGKVTTVVGVGRDQVQLKLLKLPPAPAEEMPELVRFQAEREFTAMGEGAVLDFIPLVGDAATPHQVLATSLRAAGMNEVREVGEALGVSPDRITLRACAAASLVRRATGAGHGNVALVINPLADEADLVVLADGQVVLVRTVRLPDAKEGDARQRTLGGEIRRTLAAVRQQLEDRQIDAIWMCGHGASADRPDVLAAELGQDVSTFDPASASSLVLTRTDVAESSLGRFAAVLGMALDEADRRAPVVDFLNPRRRVQARRFGRVHALAAAAAVLVVLAYGVRLWSRAAAPARELAEIQQEIQQLQPMVAQYDAVTAQADAIDRWLATDVNWLDELVKISRELRPEPLKSKKFPVAQDVVIKQLTLSTPPGSEPQGGLVDLSAVAKNSAVVSALEGRLRDERHRMEAGGGKQDHSVSGYDWAFGMRVGVAPEGETLEEAGL
jgi:Tfp pilus assembly PilM family ATPase